MSLRVFALWAVALTAGAQQASDKPSPVPRRPVRPRFSATTAAQSGQPLSRRAAGPSHAAREAGPGRSRVPEGAPREIGTACFFSAAANGGLTASGSRLDSEELAAAHASFPLGSSVRVKNLANGQTVDVRIVDRFPRSSKRVVSLSEAAARELGFVKAGTAEVELVLLEPNPSPPPR